MSGNLQGVRLQRWSVGISPAEQGNLYINIYSHIIPALVEFAAQSCGPAIWKLTLYDEEDENGGEDLGRAWSDFSWKRFFGLL